MARRKHMQEVIDQALTIHANSNKVGLGVDVINIERFKKICTRTPSFIKKMFSAKEISYCENKPEPLMHYAARFAAKEAVLKSLSVGFSQGVGYRDVEVENNKSGQPKTNLYGKANEIAKNLGVVDVPLSISHTNTEAVCVAIAITKDAIEAKKKSKIAVDEVTAQFKNLRKQLDEI